MLFHEKLSFRQINLCTAGYNFTLMYFSFLCYSKRNLAISLWPG